VSRGEASPRAAKAAARRRRYASSTASYGNMPVSAPHSVVMFAIVMRWSIERAAMPSPVNSTAWFSTSSFRNVPISEMITSLPTTPGRSAPVRCTRTVGGTSHHVSPVAQIAAASVRTTGVPTAASAP
jgi:hypothetical protein